MNPPLIDLDNFLKYTVPNNQIYLIFQAEAIDPISYGYMGIFLITV